MTLYPVFLAVAAVAVASPGPGVVMTLTNSLRYGFRGALGSVFGIAAGVFVVAIVSATGLGVLLTASATAFTVLRLVGAAYLVWLGIRLWRAPAAALDAVPAAGIGFGRRFREGLWLQVTNPKAIVFFLSVFPQFIDGHRSFAPQFTLLATSYSLLVILIHGGYALFAGRIRGWLASRRGAVAVNRAGGATLVLFGAALATARR